VTERHVLLERRDHVVKGLLPLLALLVACAPDITKNPPPASAIVVEFTLSSDPSTPSVVPLPNDLGIVNGKIMPPALKTDTAAQTEFNTSYLATLGGFPFESTASVMLSGALDATSVNATTVVGVDLTMTKTVALAPKYVAPVNDGTPAGTLSTITIDPPAGGWTRAHQYAIALVGGPNGLKGPNKEEVIGSQTWPLVSGPNPLVNCPNGNLAASDCTLGVDVLPATATDPAQRLQQQLAVAKQLEPIRLGYAPVLKQLETSLSLPREQIPIVWTFTIVDAGEVTFDPANAVIPFPNDILLSSGKVSLPLPTTGKPPTPADCASPKDLTTGLYCGLNTLDGFSTAAPPVSENSGTAGAVAQAALDPATVVPTSVGLAVVASKAPAEEQTGAPVYNPCVSCLSSKPTTPPTTPPPDELQWQLVAPLDEKTTYLAWVTGDVKDKQGKGVIANPVFALLRLTHPLVDANGHATVNILSDAQATLLEPLRAGMKPAIDAVVARGVPRSSVTLAWTFTTQSEGTVLDALYAYPSGLLAPADTLVYLYDATPTYQAIAMGAGISDVSSIGKFLVGEFTTTVLVTGPGGTLDPLDPKYLPVTFTLTLPSTPAPATGYPLTIFGHGITRSREDFLLLAGALASAGQATIAAETVYHGERTTCTGYAATTGMGMTDDAACADPVNQKCNEQAVNGRCVAKDPTKALACTPDAHGGGDIFCASNGQGACVGSAGNYSCEGGDFLRLLPDGKTPAPVAIAPFVQPAISGWNMFSLTNFFSTRDNYRQQVIDLAQLVRVLKGADPTTSLSAMATAVAGSAVSFDTTKLGYVGQSLGGILGTLFNAASPDTTNVVLNVPGGDQPQIILNGGAWGAEKMALINTLAKQGIQFGTPAFDQFVGIAQWVLDPADPTNLGWRVTHSVPVCPGGMGYGMCSGGATAVDTPNKNRATFIQFIEGDQVVPNISNLLLVAAADRPFVNTPPSYGCKPPLYCYEFTEKGDMFDTTSVPLAERHGFMLAPPRTATKCMTDPDCTSLGSGAHCFGGLCTSAQSIALTTAAQTQVATFLATGHP
jgi:dienelactone hydrolase